MQRALVPVLLSTLLIPCTALANAPTEDGLVILSLSGQGGERTTLQRNHEVVADLGPALIARTTESAAGLPLDFDAQKEELCLVSLRAWKLTELRGRTLWAEADIALVALPRGMSSGLERHVPHKGLEFGYRLLDLNASVPATQFEAPPVELSLAADPQIAAMVSQVNAQRLQSVVQDLQDLGERFAWSGGYQAATLLVDAFEAIPGLQVSTHFFDSGYSDNVIAELPGQVDPDVIYMIGGHYDSFVYSGSNAPGADDDASGTSSVLEIARILSQYAFKYTIRFAAWSAEEEGLIGSDAYCDKLVNEGDDVQAYINLDMTAYRQSGDPYDVGFITNYSSGALNDFCIGAYNTYVPGLITEVGYLSGGTSDHQSFTQHGFAACFPFESLENYSPYIHSSNDVIGVSANDFELSKMIAQGALASLALLASPVDLEITHAPLADTENASGPYVVLADVRSLLGGQVERATLYYDMGGGYVARDMVPTAQTDGYISSIPGIDLGEVRYYLEAEDDMGRMERLPAGLFADAFTFAVGIANDAFADDFEINDNGWTHGGTGQDDWMRDVPTGNGGYDPSLAHSGDKVWGNDLGVDGWDGNYKANVSNWLESPVVDCSGRSGVHLRYWRWLTVEEGRYDQARILVNGTEVWSNPYDGDFLDNSWVLHDIDISAIADNNANVRIRFTLDSDGGVEYGGWNIDDLHVGTLEPGDLASLSSSEVYIHASTGGSIDFTLAGGSEYASRNYTLALSASGTSPGTPYGDVVVPLNRDRFTDYGLAHLNTPLFDNFAGILDGSGSATATLNAPSITWPGLLGATVDFAWVTMTPSDYASDPAAVLVVP